MPFLLLALKLTPPANLLLAKARHATVKPQPSANLVEMLGRFPRIRLAKLRKNAGHWTIAGYLSEHEVNRSVADACQIVRLYVENVVSKNYRLLSLHACGLSNVFRNSRLCRGGSLRLTFMQVYCEAVNRAVACLPATAVPGRESWFVEH